VQEPIPGAFKKPPKRYAPSGLSIIHEDRDLLIVDKIDGLLSIGNEREKEKTAQNLLNEYLRKGNSASKKRVYIVNRLDRDLSGLLICTKEELAKRELQNNWHEYTKTFYAVVHGHIEAEEGIMTDPIKVETKKGAIKSTKIVDAETKYKVIGTSKGYTMVELTVMQTAKHQIRIHLAELGNPIVGDKLYGTVKGQRRLALHSASATIPHPHSKKVYKFETEIPKYFKGLIKHG
jgi:RluA family pseudouridine synthase